MSWARIASAVLLFATGCGTARSSAWLDPAELPTPTQADYPDTDAIYLLHEVTLIQDFAKANPSWSVSYHDAILVLNEAGREHSNVRVPYRKGYDVVELAARSIAPDGTITPLAPDRIYDTGAPEPGELEIRVFALPRVAVGTVIELRYVLRRDEWLYTTWFQDLWSKVPSLLTRVTYTVHGRVAAAAKVYGSDVPFRESHDHTYTTVVWEGRDLPARIDEPDAPPASERTPHVVFVLKQLRYSAVVDYNGDWAHAIAEDFYTPLVKKRDFVDGFELPSAFAPLRTEPVPERIARVYDAVRAIPHRVSNAGADNVGVRPLQQVLAERTATPWERTVLLAELLRALRVEATYALTRSSGIIDPFFPRRRIFDAGLVYVPVQPGVERELWLQPSCTQCALGQLRWKSIGVNALLMESQGGESAPRWVVTDAPPEPPATQLVERDITLDATGNARVSERHVLEGRFASAARRARAALSQREHDDQVKRWVTADLAGADVSEVTYNASPDIGRPVEVTLSWQSDALTTRAGDALLVDLTAPTFTIDHLQEKQARRSDLVLYGVVQRAFLYRLTPPPGYQVLEPPPASSLACPAGQADATSAYEGDTLVYRVRVTTVPGRWSKDELDPLRAFFRDLVPLLDVKLTLVPTPADGIPPTAGRGGPAGRGSD